MKHARKLTSLLLALVMVFALATTAFAQDVGTEATGKGTITISNAAKGETYSVYKLFDATVSSDGKAINYTGDIPTALSTYFTADSAGNITATDAAKDGKNMSDNLKAALKTWTESTTATVTAESDGSILNFKGLDYGYYVVTTSQGNQTISVDSTMPDVTIVDKNAAAPSNLNKTVPEGGDNVNIGDAVTYTVSFKTSNYYGAGEDAKQIVSYTITDTLPEFLRNVTVTSITIGGADYKVDGAVPQFDATTKSITIPWVKDGTSLYKNGAEIVITYTAVVTAKAAIDGNGNANKVTVTWTTKDSDQPGPDKIEKEETIFTYAIALKKVNNKGKALPDAVFQFPFYVQSTADADGAYIYAGTTAGEGLTNQITTPDSGVIIVKGVKTGSYEIKEVKAPAGYNKLTAPVTVEAVKTGSSSTHTTVYLDENGNTTTETTTTEVKVELANIAATAVVVVNKAGTELPSTGGMGTTIFYVLGFVLVVGAGVLLVTKKRMSQGEV